MASVLRINPERIRVTNIVPGNRRRLQEPASCTAAGAVEQSVCDAALVSDPGGTDCTNAGCTYVAPSLSAGGLDIGFDIAANDPCETVNCGPHGECSDDGACICEANWLGSFVAEGCSASNGRSEDCALTAVAAAACTASTGAAEDCALVPATDSTPATCNTVANEAECTYVPPVVGSCAAVPGNAEICAVDACAGYVQGTAGVPSTTCPAGCTLAGDGETETCTATVTDCATGYTPGDAATPSTSCPAGCTFVAAAACSYVPREVGCSENPCADLECGAHGSCTSSVGGFCTCTGGWTGALCDIEPLPGDPCVDVTCPAPTDACHVSGTCLPRTCVAKQSIECLQPADGATDCPGTAAEAATDCVTGYSPGTEAAPSTTCPAGCTLTNAVAGVSAESCRPTVSDCLFFAGGSCSDASADSEEACAALTPAGTWQPSTQGTCAVSDQTACTEALMVSTGGSLDGTRCDELKCTYSAGGSCTPQIPLVDGTPCDDGDTPAAATCGAGNDAAGNPCAVNCAGDGCVAADGDCAFVAGNVGTDNDVCTAGVCGGTEAEEPTLSCASDGSGVATSTQGNEDTFAELTSVGNALIESATTGTLDLGYDVTGMDVVLPDDVCGVPGGDGTSCLDVCGVANGDGSSCADVCGIPNGDGFSCRDACDSCAPMNPNVAADVVLCDGIDVSGPDGAADAATCSGAGGGGRCLYTGGVVGGDGSACAPPVVFDVASCLQTERHRVQMRAVAGTVGAIVLSFNGELTGEISIPYASQTDIAMKLSALPSVGTVNVFGLLNDDAPAEATSGSTRVDMVVEFAGTGNPPNLGKLPLIAVESYPVGVIESSVLVERVCTGQPPAGHRYEEQLITLPAIGGAFTLGFDTDCTTGYIPGNATALSTTCPDTCILTAAIANVDESCTAAVAAQSTGPIAWNASPRAVALALQEMDLLAPSSEGTAVVEVLTTGGRDDLVPSVVSAETPAFTVRFYPPELSQLLLLSETLSPRSCTAKAGVACGQPADGDTACPDNDADCVFTAGDSSTQGSCAISDQAACSASLLADVTGAACTDLKCAYGPKELEVGNLPLLSLNTSALQTSAAASVAQHGPSGQAPTSWLPTTCADNRQNGDETGMDCGGSCSTCPLPPPPPPPPCDQGCCTAKDPNSVSCGQPADGDTTCPDNPSDCVFTADPAGGSQGSCALTSWDDCQAALSADDSGFECTSLKCSYTPPPAPPTTIVIAPVQLGVCGDGSRASSEGCDDGNVDNGDGCDSSCSIESGFICPTNYIRATSVCVQPQIALVEFDASSLASSASEGDTVTLTVTRVGTERTCLAKDSSIITCGAPSAGDTVCPDNAADCVFTADPGGSDLGSCALTEQTGCTAALAADSDGTSCNALKCSYEHGSLGAGSVDFTTVDSTAFAARGDFAARSGTLSFAENEASKTIEVEVLADGIYDEADETMAVALSAPANGLLGEAEAVLAIITIANSATEECAGWSSLALPSHAVPPCTNVELAAPVANNCAARGTCPSEGSPLSAHEANCTYTCEPGYFPVGNQPTCADGAVSASVICQFPPAQVQFAAGSLSRTVTEGSSTTVTLERDGTERSCSAKPSSIECLAPADGATSCDPPQHCVFTAPTTGTQGSCALTDQATCAAAIDADTEGDACKALKCTYIHGSLGAGTVPYSFDTGEATAADGDFTTLSGAVTFANNQREATIELDALVDDVFDEGEETVQLSLNAPNDDYVAVLGDFGGLFASISIVNEELCDGWPPTLPSRATDPCSAAELLQAGNNACAARGTCPASGSALAQHPPDCQFVCNAGYDLVGDQPSCGGGLMTATVSCRQQEATVGFADASLAVSVTEGGTATLTVRRVGTPRQCVAKDPSVITCGTPADGDTECPDHPDDCVFTAGADSTQGSCALTTQEACTASIDDDAEGDACMALGCVYTHGSLGPGSVQFASEDGTALSRAANSPTEFATGVLGEDFVAVSDSITFASNQEQATIDVVVPIDRAWDEPPEAFAVRLSSSSSDELLSWATTATVTILDVQSCPNWPPLLPAHTKIPCSEDERVAVVEGTGNRSCDGQGSCPDSYTDHVLMDTGPHLHNCSFVCLEGFRPTASALQPSCEEPSTMLPGAFTCEKLAKVIEASVEVSVSPEIIAEGTAERVQFEADFSSGMSRLLGVSVERIVVTGISAADDRRRRLQAALRAVVDFVVLPDPSTGSNDGSFGAVAAVLMRDLSTPGVAICPADCEACTAASTLDSSSCCQTASPADACARSYSSASSVSASEEQVAELMEQLQSQPGTVTASITLLGLDAWQESLGTTFATEVAHLLGVDSTRVQVVSTIAADDGVQVEFVVLPAQAGGGQTERELKRSLEDTLGSGDHLIAGYEIDHLAYEGRPDQGPSTIVIGLGGLGALVVLLGVCIFVEHCHKAHKEKREASKVKVPKANDFEQESSDSETPSTRPLPRPLPLPPLQVPSATGGGPNPLDLSPVNLVVQESRDEEEQMLAAVDMLQHEVLRNATKQAKRRVLRTRRETSKRNVTAATDQVETQMEGMLAKVLQGDFEEVQALHSARGHHRESTSDSSEGRVAADLMSQYDAELGRVQQTLRSSSSAHSAALAARLEEKRRAMAERAVSVERIILHQQRADTPMHESTPPPPPKGQASSRRPLQLKVGAAPSLPGEERSQKEANVHLWKQKVDALAKTAAKIDDGEKKNPNSQWREILTPEGALTGERVLYRKDDGSMSLIAPDEGVRETVIERDEAAFNQSYARAERAQRVGSPQK